MKWLTMGRKSCSPAGSKPWIFILIVLKPTCYLYTTLLHIGFGVNINTYMFICLAVRTYRFWVFNMCSFLHNFFIIDEIIKDSLHCIHHVGFNILKISPFRLAPFSALLITYWESVYFLKLHLLQWYAVMAGQISKLFKPRKTADTFSTKCTRVFSIE